MRARTFTALAAFLVVTATSAVASAQRMTEIIGRESITNRPLVLITVIAGLALVPFVLIMITSFVKIAVVMSIVRQAIGTQQIPPTQVITGLAIILTIYIMTPVGLDIYNDSKDAFLRGVPPGRSWEQVTVAQIQAVASEA
ncbi:MAG: hypothetical protein HYZ27_12390, partial [Deltaproteobacteria bacterium]|nr:hypothetical protein [Deltaproteobacteria bacterium]